MALIREREIKSLRQAMRDWQKEYGETPWSVEAKETSKLLKGRAKAIGLSDEEFEKLWIAETEGSEKVYWWVRLGDVAEYEQFDTFEEAKEHIEEATGKPFSETHWINPYGLELGGYRMLNYISFFEGDEAAQPTERHLYGKVTS